MPDTVERLSHLRQRGNRFVEHHEIAWELTMGLLAAIFIAIGLVEDYGGLAGETLEDLVLVGDLVTIVFFCEFAFRFYAAPSRKAYLKGHWIDLIALLPAIRFLRFTRLAFLLRITRLARLAMLARFFSSSERVLASAKGIARQNNLHFVVAALLGVTVICAFAFYDIESATNKSISSLEDALWWGLVTLTTVGYGDVYPVTLQGRIISAALMILGIVLWGMVTASVTTYFLTPKGTQNGVLKSVGDHFVNLNSLSIEELHTLKQLANSAIEGELARRQTADADTAVQKAGSIRTGED